ncbi:hypothetical protein FE392_13485 [Xenorhabdus sp. 12]|uniref:Cysteine-rich CPCC domain-containing protein n=1 Tax=Xenorhabdus santafensis TaxID=2582833 RepID=A0ABU4SC27_9GAMM|nr:CPCC family cysteine-rich protein [Xenorhabdus sp. 12]MDX7988330.1 hypothetical protein [Xenorhabdus sp. 12]
MKIEFLYSEVISFLKLHSLFTENVDSRIQLLFELGEIEGELPSEAIKQKYNDVILDNFNYSKLLRNCFFEEIIKDITGNEILIIDRDDNLITGVHCSACNYIVFEDNEDAFYEICPVCRWQNDGSLGDNYSSCNHGTMNEYKETEFFKHQLNTGSKKYMKFKN